MADTPAVLLNGPRQSGKTTLATSFASSMRPYFTLDDDTVLTAARSDPVQFVCGIEPRLIRIGGLADSDYSPG